MTPEPVTAPHVGLSVPEIDDAISWYTSVLGFRLLTGPLEVVEDESPGGMIGAQIYGHGFKRWQFAHLATTDNFGLELFQFDSPKTTARSNNFEYWFGGPNHIGLTAPDIDDTVEAICANGGRARTPIMTVDPDRHYRIVYLEDPWGSIVELCSHPYVTMWESSDN